MLISTNCFEKLGNHTQKMNRDGTCIPLKVFGFKYCGLRDYIRTGLVSPVELTSRYQL